MVVTIASHLSAAVAFLVLTVLFVVAGRGSLTGRLLIAACGLSALWAAGVAYQAAFGHIPVQATAVLEIGRSSAWVLFMASLVFSRTDSARWRGAALLFVALVAAAVLADQFSIAERQFGGETAALTYSILARLMFAIIGLVLIENIFRRATEDALWSLKHLVLGVGLIFGYDFFLYSEALLFNRVDSALFDARGFVNALSVPLLAVAASRNRDWSVDIHISRQAVFHTATMVGSGIYLILMAAVGYYLRTVGGDWGAVLQVAFSAAAIIVIVVALFSATIRARIRLAISRNFFTYRYDYRTEWLRFIDTISAGDGKLHERAIRAVANIVESPAGALWVRRREDELFFPAAAWNFPPDLPHIGEDAPLVLHLEESRKVIDLIRTDGSEAPAAQTVPGWMRELRRAWLIVPFIHREQLQGFLLLGRPRAKDVLSWEEEALLKTVGLQVASYLAEEDALRSLVNAQNLQEFNRRFAFVVHDIKNLASQLSLILSNAERHKNNPAFQEDVMTTVRHAVAKMESLLGQLKLDRQSAGVVAPVALSPLLRQAAAACAGRIPPVALDLPEDEVVARADQERLDAVVRHLLQNAMEAVTADGNVALRLRRDGGRAAIEVIDDGPGMDAEFIREQLFRPLHTTKPTGSGLGGYQTRKLVRDMGGKLEVVSAPGAGTTMRVLLPLAVSEEGREDGKMRRIGAVA